jgi:uncharacterized LabA/DUF88 family protein
VVVYVDAYNLYYGGRQQCGRGQQGWRWLDIRGLATAVINQSSWQDASVKRVVYCTARIDEVTNPSGFADQDVYLLALRKSKSVDHIEFGNYVSRVKNALLATKDPTTSRPVLTTSQWPLMVRDSSDGSVSDARFMVSYLHQEEKGSDVNVGAHLLIDILTDEVDAVVVVSNDSDLRYPVSYARTRVPVGIVNPRNSIRPATSEGTPLPGSVATGGNGSRRPTTGRTSSQILSPVTRSH